MDEIKIILEGFITGLVTLVLLKIIGRY